MFVERKAFEAVGGFDEELSSGEDTDLGYRLNSHGFRTQFDETLVIFHRGEPKSLRDFFAQQVWYSNREVWRRMAIQGSRKVGQRALRYGILHIAGLSAVACSILIGVWWRRPEIPAVVTLAYLLIPLLLAARAARVTRSFGSFLSLALLYWLYGVARAAYLLGLTNLTHKTKRF
jgi:GT2 family glycosyltransferase